MNSHRPKVCRICRAPDNDDLISVRLIQDHITIARMVEELTGIQVMQDKHLPQNICLQCLERLRNAHQLRQQCIESDRLLREELGPGERKRNDDTVKLEIVALDEQPGREEAVQEVSMPGDMESAEKVDLDIIVEETEEESLGGVAEEREGNKLAAAQELIDILAPEENVGVTNQALSYLHDYDENDYEVLLESEYFDYVRFTAAICCGCAERFEDREDLMLHGLTVHQSETKRYRETENKECPVCYDQFLNLDALSFHQNRIGLELYHCHECGLLLENREHLVYHLETVHSIVEELTQEGNEETIDEDTKSNRGLARTLVDFSEDQYRLLVTDEDYDLIEFLWLQCCGCERLFEHREEFEAHSKEHHLPKRKPQDEQNPFECSICYERFSKKASLTFHRNKPTKRRMVCRVCEGIFEGRSAIQKHMVDCHKMVAEKDDFEDIKPVIEEDMEVDEYDHIVEEECKSDAYSVQGIEFIEEALTEDDQDIASTDDDEEPKSDEDDEDEIVHPKDSSKYVSTRQRKQMALIPGNFVRIAAEYDGYNIVEITKERCCACLKFFDSLQELDEHAKEHQMESLTLEQNNPGKKSISYGCEYCLKKFDIAMIYVVHKRIREQKQFYQCRLCDFVIESESRLKNHMLYNDQHAKFFNLIREDVSDRYDTVQLPGFQCCGCGAHFEDESALSEHSQKDHPRDPKKDTVKRKYACDICDRRFNNAGEVTTHQARKGCPIRHCCKLCDFQTQSNARMLKHLYSKIHNESLPAIEVQPIEVRANRLGSVRYCCFDECNAFAFPNFAQLSTHVQQRHQSEREANEAMAEAEDDILPTGRRWQCDCCGRVFRTGAILKQHQFAHRVPKSFVCAVCGEAKANKAALTVHEMKHTGERPHACDMCDKRFTSKTILNSHMKCHLPKQHQCPDCGEKFARGENLKRHIRHRHSEATFSCSFCARKSKTREAQIQHERSHTGEKPFQCRTEGCSKRYGSITDRRRHEMASHTGERPHRCSFCATSFVRKRQLTIHERKHTGERPFACEQCGKGFKDAPLLKKHVCSQ
ncbi:zinc finger protein 585A [Aedes albopictus]|uniref:C2h2-type zn-finger protein n=1 Tax=Aedes albopictus TaxID=7160 RepID=A0ABM1Z5C6_AEDAL